MSTIAGPRIDEPERVLVAEDDASTRHLLACALERWGLRPVVVADGTSALRELTSPRPPRRALVDWMMPGMSGPEVCRRARSAGARAHLVLLTARDRPECVVEGLESGADDYVVKPFDLAVLRARLLRHERRALPDLRDEAPRQLGHFRLREKLGEGGMGTVHRAEHMQLGHSVAVKLLRSTFVGTPRLRARFEAEARALSLLRSDHIVTIFDYGVTDGGTPYLVLEHLRGRTLSSCIDSAGPLPLMTVARIVTDVARGLAIAHASGITHRDVKPDNVFLEEVEPGSQAGPPYRGKLLDFGLARLEVDEGVARQTRRGHFVGTLGYAAPEQIAGAAVGPAADLWALGATAFAAATGRPAITEGSASSMAFLTQRAELLTPSEVDPRLPRAFDDWMRRACAREPASRFGDAPSMARALRAVVLHGE